MKNLFKSQGQWKLVEEGAENDLPDDARALLYIQQGVSTEILSRIKDALSSKEAWEILKNIYYDVPEMVEPKGRENGRIHYEPPHDLDVKWFREVNYHIRHNEYDRLINVTQGGDQSVNLMNDPLLSVVIAKGKTDMAIRLINKMEAEMLINAKNYDEDTALHVAATLGNCRLAEALHNKNKDLVKQVNKKMETPLHKAVLNGQKDIFWLLVCLGASPHDRREDGATMLHCAIMANAPALALKIAKQYPDQITSRNDIGVTPLQLMVTIPEAFRSQLVLGLLDSVLYDWIPLEEDSDHKISRVDEEAPAGTPLSSHLEVTSKDQDEYAIVEYYSRTSKSIRSKFPSQYSTLFDLLELVNIPGFPTIQHLERRKKKHKAAMDLVGHLANKKEYFDFYCKGYSGSGFNHSTSFPSPPGFVGRT
ncbi:hypothetical protein Cni_G28339 [Canna indica]|uniref:Uncharacterized protein n=1 Tax=Canna indica TaxID=4628 RepID=A0AAQ3L787_9LILI|nr:hypothetical protein Cni_G28339 [Canna indica]